MQNKSAQKSWNEIEMLISSIAIALTLGLWNLFASSKKPSIASTDANVNLPPQPDTSTVVSITPTALPTNPLTLLPGQVLLLGGAVPLSATQSLGQPSTSTTTTTTTTTVRPSGGKKGGGGGGGGGGAATTHSSHP